MAAKNKMPEYCMSEEDKLAKLEGMPRVIDTFWNADMSQPPSTQSGKRQLTYRINNKGLGYTHRERYILGIYGLLPAAVWTMQQQVEAHQKYFATLTSDLAKYIFLTDLESCNKKLFFRVLMSHPDKYLKVFLSADSGFLVKMFSYSYSSIRGMFITIKERGHIFDTLSNFQDRGSVRCLIVSNGKSVHSWGDKGVHGTPVIYYKMCSHVVHGGINPTFILPVTLDVGTDNESLLNDKQYVGVRQKRATAAEFEAFFEEFTLSVIRLFGPRAIIQIKDFGSLDSMRHLAQYRHRQCFMNIDVQCLGACGLAGVLGSMRITQMPFKDNTLLFHGLTSFNIGMAHMCVAYLKRLGLNETSAKSRIWFFDDKGLVVTSRAKVPEQLREFQQVHAPITDLVEAIDALKPNILIGSSLKPNAFTKEVLKAMERSAQVPIIFAMSRPLAASECTANDAFVYTKGRCIFISGIALPPLKYANKVYQPGYCSVDYILSGLTQGVILSGMTTVPDEVFLVAVDRLSNIVWPNDLAKRDVYPPVRKLRCINLQVADAVFCLAYRRSWASLWPEPENSMDYIKSKQYDLEYINTIPHIYTMSDKPMKATESEKL